MKKTIIFIPLLISILFITTIVIFNNDSACASNKENVIEKSTDNVGFIDFYCETKIDSKYDEAIIKTLQQRYGLYVKIIDKLILLINNYEIKCFDENLNEINGIEVVDSRKIKKYIDINSMLLSKLFNPPMFWYYLTLRRYQPLPVNDVNSNFDLKIELKILLNSIIGKRPFRSGYYIYFSNVKKIELSIENINYINYNRLFPYIGYNALNFIGRRIELDPEFINSINVESALTSPSKYFIYYDSNNNNPWKIIKLYRDVPIYIGL